MHFIALTFLMPVNIHFQKYKLPLKGHNGKAYTLLRKPFHCVPLQTVSVLVHEPNPEMRLKMSFRSTPCKT